MTTLGFSLEEWEQVNDLVQGSGVNPELVTLIREKLEDAEESGSEIDDTLLITVTEVQRGVILDFALECDIQACHDKREGAPE